MAYSTRRKSVNLSLLGIHVPRPSAHRPPPSRASSSPTAASSAGASAPAPPNPSSPNAATTATSSPDSRPPPSKKIKRSHSDAVPAASLPAAASPAKPALPRPSLAAHTPPPSPPPSGAASHPPAIRVDTEGINDDVVVATIRQLEKARNRPHLLKELATAIAGHVHVVETSANQSAIICSRLTNFMKRPWTNLAPCPIGKELIGTHPKRLYFYLSNQPRLPFPEPERTVSNRIISPSLTSAADDDEEHAHRARTELSPSPEVELTPPDLDLDVRDARASSFPSHLGTDAPQTPGFGPKHTSPPLDLHEHEFTQTAESLQQRRRSEMEQLSRAQSVEVKVEAPVDDAMVLDSDAEDDAEKAARRCREAADTVFGATDPNFALRKVAALASSPMMLGREIDPPATFSARAVPFPLTLAFDDRMDAGSAWMELKSPETVELDELECLFETY